MQRARVPPLKGLNTGGRAVMSYRKVVPFKFPKAFPEQLKEYLFPQ